MSCIETKKDSHRLSSRISCDVKLADLLLSLRKFTTMSFPLACRSEFSKFVSDHVFGNEYRRVDLAVVDTKRQSDEFRVDSAVSRPGFDDRLLVG